MVTQKSYCCIYFTYVHYLRNATYWYTVIIVSCKYMSHSMGFMKDFVFDVSFSLQLSAHPPVRTTDAAVPEMDVRSVSVQRISLVIIAKLVSFVLFNVRFCWVFFGLFFFFLQLLGGCVHVHSCID